MEPAEQFGTPPDIRKIVVPLATELATVLLLFPSTTKEPPDWFNAPEVIKKFPFRLRVLPAIMFNVPPSIRSVELFAEANDTVKELAPTFSVPDVTKSFAIEAFADNDRTAVFATANVSVLKIAVGLIDRKSVV